jgi:hypothetical protein
VALAGVAFAEPPGKDGKLPRDPSQPFVSRLTVRAAPVPPGRTYSLLPDDRDRVPGNAAPFWLRASIALRETPHKWTDRLYEWASRTETPLKDLPREEVRRLLDDYRQTLRLADEAALRDHCEWDVPPLTLEALSDLSLVEAQPCRMLANLLALRTRLELAEGHPDRALHSIQVGMALARDIGGGPTVVHGLVGIALAHIMLNHVEELLEQPEAPNLYWALTTLPQPLVDLRRAVGSELATVYRSYPELRRLDEGRLGGAQAQAILEGMLAYLTEPVPNPSGPPRRRKLDLKELTAANRQEARPYLTAHGWKTEEVNALPDVQAVALYLLERYREDRADVLHWDALPVWQGQEGLLRLNQRLREDAAHHRGDVLGEVLLPWAAKVNQARGRLEEFVAALRCVEAVRLDAAAHDGKLPASLGDVTEVPLPVNPFTGKGFDGEYKVSGDTAVFDMPPPPGMPGGLGRRYEIRRPR